MVGTLQEGTLYTASSILTSTNLRALVSGAVLSDVDQSNVDAAAVSFVQAASVAPATTEGSTWWNTTDKNLQVYDATGALWRVIGGVNGTFDVTEYGALGDDSTDNATAIDDARTALIANGGGILFFPAGVYQTSATLEMASDMWVLGSGRGSTTLKLSAAADVELLECPSGGALTDMKVSDLTLDGDQANQTTDVDTVLLAGDIDEFDMVDVTVVNNQTSGIQIAESSVTQESLRFTRVSILESQQKAVNIVEDSVNQKGPIVFKNCTVRRYGLDGTGNVQGIHANDWCTFEGCQFEEAGATNCRHLQIEGSNTGGGNHSIVSGCRFIEETLGPVYPLWLGAQHVTVTGCVFRADVATSTGGYGIYMTEGVADPSAHNAITGNTFNTAGPGIRLTSTAFYNTISGNTFQAQLTQPAIVVDGGENIITGNYVTHNDTVNNTNAFLENSTATGNAYSGNVIDGVGSTGAFTYGFRFAGTNAVVTGNTIKNITRQPFWITSSDAGEFVISGNVFEACGDSSSFEDPILLSNEPIITYHGNLKLGLDDGAGVGQQYLTQIAAGTTVYLQPWDGTALYTGTTNISNVWKPGAFAGEEIILIGAPAGGSRNLVNTGNITLDSASKTFNNDDVYKLVCTDATPGAQTWHQSTNRVSV